jgi:hypothetical protein
MEPIRPGLNGGSGVTIEKTIVTYGDPMGKSGHFASRVRFSQDTLRGAVPFFDRQNKT